MVDIGGYRRLKRSELRLCCSTIRPHLILVGRSGTRGQQTGLARNAELFGSSYNPPRTADDLSQRLTKFFCVLAIHDDQPPIGGPT